MLLCCFLPTLKCVIIPILSFCSNTLILIKYVDFTIRVIAITQQLIKSGLCEIVQNPIGLPMQIQKGALHQISIIH